MALDARHRYIARVLSQQFSLPVPLVEEVLFQAEQLITLANFFSADGEPSRVIFFHQSRVAAEVDGELAELEEDAPAELFMTTGDIEQLKGHAVYFLRVDESAAVGLNSADTDLSFGVISPNSLEHLQVALTELYVPLITHASKRWDADVTSSEATSDFFEMLTKLCSTLSDAVGTLDSGFVLRRPDKVHEIENKAQRISQAGSEPEVVGAFERVVEDWCRGTEQLLQETDEAEDVGPETELAYWRNRAAKLNSISEQLKSRDCRVVMGVLAVSKSRVLKRWKGLDPGIGDAANEAKDNIKYLATLEKYHEPLASGPPPAIVDALPGLLNAIKMMHTVSRFYNTPERLTALFRKITQRIITTCKAYICGGGTAGGGGAAGGGAAVALWDQPLPGVIARMRECLVLCETYQEQYYKTRDKLMMQPKGKQFDFSETAIFGKADLFCRRVEKLADLFSTVDQFSTLASHRVGGMESLMGRFRAIVAELRAKPYELLDYQNGRFDRDHLGFNASILELEASLQSFINASFESIASTEHALLLLKQFQAVLHREALRDDLDSKLMVIFHNYGLDLETVQRLYEKQKQSPPVVRNAPPVSGAIMWSRQLMRRIEEPMLQFQANRNLMSTKESKKIVKTYNRIACTIVEFETLWHIAWTKSIEAAKAGLSATLIVRHPSNGKLYVNFDREILQLIRESKCLIRMGVEVPESARTALLQESKFKTYYNLLTYSLQQYRAVVLKVLPVLSKLLRPHLLDLECAIQPGMVTLTWTSMNIDGYLHHVHAALFKLDNLVVKTRDLVENRIERNLKAVSRMMLVYLPDDESFALDHFVSSQEKFVKEQAAVMAVKSDEVEEAVEDLLELISTYPLEPGIAPTPPEEQQRLKEHYGRLMYRAVLNCTKASLAAIKRRVGSRSAGSFFFVDRPFFDVDVELTIPHVSMTPSLAEIQAAINRCSRAILAASKQLGAWGNSRDHDAGATLFDGIAKDKEIVKTVLLLTGSIEGTKRSVHQYLNQFASYEWLWTESKAKAYSTFLAGQPSLEDFESELQGYVQVEAKIQRITPVHNIGALSLDTAPLKYSLKAEATAWKLQYTQNLQLQAQAELERIVSWMDGMGLKLKLEVHDLDTVRNAMGYLRIVREKEGTAELDFAPVEEMYSMLARFDARMTKEELDAVGDLPLMWKKLKRQADEVADALAAQQAALKKELIRNIKVFAADVAQFRNEWEANGPSARGIAPMQGYKRLRRFKALHETKQQQWEEYRAGEELFGLQRTDHLELIRTKKEIELLEKVYGLFSEVMTTVGNYRNLLWSEVTERMGSMLAQMGDFQTACKKMPKALREYDAFVELKHTIDDFLKTLPLVQALAHASMRSRHWNQLMSVTSRHLNITSDSFRLSTLLEVGLLEFSDDVEEITGAAVKELQLEEKLNRISEEWSDCPLAFAPLKSRRPAMLKGAETAELMERLEETQMQLGSMMASRFITPFREEVQSWLMKLSSVSEIVEQWVQVQAMWMHLEAIFTLGDIAKQLPQEAKRFQGINTNWEKLMSRALETRGVLQYCCANETLKQLLPHMLEQLEVCQKALSGYLDQKRAAFPRFYFVSDAVLLEVLSQGSDLEAIQSHLASIFDSIDAVEFRDGNQIVSMISPEGQTVVLATPVEAKGNIEEWLSGLLAGMQGTIGRLVESAARDCEAMELKSFTHKYPAQVALLGIQLLWTLDAEDAIFKSKSQRSAMKDNNKKNQARLDQLVEINMLSNAEVLAHGKWTRKKLETMITIEVHQRDVFDEDIFKQRVREVTDFQWMKQARFYWDGGADAVKISIADVDFKYCNEYLGVKERLCITPLTDRCYITLSQALGMFLGGAPSGPAGTGKTETTKDMGFSLGKYVLVTNCSDQMDSRSTGRVFKGLAQSGCWGCFDEFNRINPEVLSVVAQQVGCVLAAIRQGDQALQFTDGQSIRLNSEVGFFITMSPGYAGRQELPENLKSLFRGVTMMVPNRRLIMQVKLTAAGYKDNALLSKKFNVLYHLCEQQLSKQPHYDFGLRNVLAVLRTAGQSKRDDPAAAETLLLMRTLRDMNLSKFVAEDITLFLSLIDDLFPGMQAPKMKHAAVEGALATALLELGLQPHADWVSKVLKVYEMSLVRHSLMVVGTSGTGKTTIVRALHAALKACEASPELPPMVGQAHREVRMNPKAITAAQMFGSLDHIANEWTEGVFALLWRKANKDKKHFTWLVLDGPIDAIWIENLNTVMDDNTILTLANNDRIPMLRPNVTLHFEVEDLRNASPATVSRAGIIYVSLSDLGWLPMVQSWLAKRKSTEAAALLVLFNSLTQPLLEFVAKSCAACMQCSPVALLTSHITLLSALLGEFGKERSEIDPELMERIFIYCSVWSIAVTLETDDRVKVDNFLRKQTKNLPPAQFPETVYEFRVDEGSGEWVHWGSKLPAWELPPGVDVGKAFPTLLVPTIDSVRNEYVLQLNVQMGRAVLLIGGPGTAKTSTLLQSLARFDRNTTMTKKLSFSSATTPLMFQRQVESSIEKRQGRTFGPPGGKKMVVFVDDMSMPEFNLWGDQVTLEIVRQLMENSGFYSLDRPGEWKNILDLLFVGAMLKPGGGKSDIPSRAKRHFHVLNVALPSVASINQIFGNMVKAHFDADSGTPPDVLSTSERLVEMTVNLWEAVKSKMLPTPAKFHYIFNLRDLSRVFQGILMCPVLEVLESEAVLISLWAHECERVFADRLVDQSEKKWFAGAMHKILEDRFGRTRADRVTEAPSYFVDFMRETEEDPEPGEEYDTERIYEPIPDFEALRDIVQDKMGRFNKVHALQAAELVLFNDALLHFMRISRILRTPRGSALLVGVGGSGKQSLTRLAAYTAGASFFQPKVTKSYSASSLVDDFKPLYTTAGVSGKGVAMIFTDKEIAEEGFLEYVNLFLNTGELPNLFSRDEVEAIVGELSLAYAKEHEDGGEPSAEDMWNYFINRVRANLHLVLCFTPVGDKFRSRAQKFPAVINGCTVDWFLPWPEEALTDVSRSFMESYTIQDEDADRVREALILHMGKVHSLVRSTADEFFQRFCRHVYVTPKSFLTFIQAYMEMYEEKVIHVENLGSSINTGLFKLEQAKMDVENMKGELREKEATLAVASEKSNSLLQEITAAQAKAEKKKSEVQAIKDVLAAEYAGIADEKCVIEDDLEAAKPALDAAAEALNAITPKDIIMLKNLKKPPEMIKRLFDAVLILLMGPLLPTRVEEGKSGLVIEPSYANAMALMSRSAFLDELQNYAKDRMNDETVELLYPYTGLPFSADNIIVPESAKSLTFEAAKKASGNVAGICIWCQSMVLYTMTAKVVKPKIASLQAAEAKLSVAQKKLTKAQGDLDVVQADLNKMQASFDQAMAEKQAVQADAEATQLKMDSASRLIAGLGGEYTRWKASSDSFAEQIRRLAGDVALACVLLVYAGPFNAEFRELLLRSRAMKDCAARHIPHTLTLNIAAFLADDSTVGDWALEGLPSDELSVQNGIMVTKSRKWPLLIDPQGQGQGWIKLRDSANGLHVTSIGDKRFRGALEDAMAFGQPLLLEKVEEVIDPILDPVLDKLFQKSGRSYKITLADKECEYSESFRLYMACNLSNPHFAPELFTQVTVINFTVTTLGLEQQLLGRVVQRERPELEQQRSKLVENGNADKKILRGLEDELLGRLALSTGNLLDDTSLIEALQTTKRTSTEVGQRLANAAEAETRISKVREEYRPVATLGALIYFLVVDMTAINTMYEVSLQQFIEIFNLSIANADRAHTTPKRIAHIMSTLKLKMTCYIQRGLFERHKVIWALMLAMRIDFSEGLLTVAAIDALLKGGSALDINSEKQKPLPWLPDSVWLNILQLSRGVRSFADLPDAINRNDLQWKTWFDDDAPEEQRLPDFDERYSQFEKMLVVRALREDRTLLCVQKYITSALGLHYVDSRPLNLREVEAEATPTTPIIAILSQGADPTAAIFDLAKRMKTTVRTISMGHGQELAARKLLQMGAAQGGWVLLQNCHLGLKFMGELEVMLLRMEEVAPDFRLWITSEPHRRFPIGLLHMSIKMTNEAPAGMRAGLKGTYAWLNQDMLDTVSLPEYKSMLYALAFMHSAVQERRKFGPLGFCVPYEFNTSDLAASVQFLQNHLTDVKASLQPQQAARPVDWTLIKYMVCEVQYGGRITDDWDRRLFNTYGKAWLAPRILPANFEFYPGYSVPDTSEMDGCRRHIDQLPLVDNPELFGLHSNADLAFRTANTQQVLGAILDIQPKVGGGGGGLTREEDVLPQVVDLLAKLPADFKMGDVRSVIKSNLGGPKPLNICLQQEVALLQQVYSTVRQTLDGLKLAIAGTSIMSLELTDALDALFLARVPSAWTTASQLVTPALGVWFANIVQRGEQLTNWMRVGRPTAFWLAGFFNPQGFLTANRQEVCRKHARDEWALDDVTNLTKVLAQEVNEVRRPPDEGVNIHGLFLDGARWDKASGKIVDLQPKALFEALPVIHVTGVQITDVRWSDTTSGYVCPCYKNPKRGGDNFIFTVELASNEASDKWVLRGVALLASKD